MTEPSDWPSDAELVARVGWDGWAWLHWAWSRRLEGIKR